MANPRMTKEDREWQARNDLRTLQEAEEIRNDKTRMRRAQSEATKQQKALNRIAKPTTRARKR